MRAVMLVAIGITVLVLVCCFYAEPLHLREGLVSESDVKGMKQNRSDLDQTGTGPSPGSSQTGQNGGKRDTRAPTRQAKSVSQLSASPRANARACGCDPWSEYCVVPPHDSPGYGCVRAFDDHEGDCGGLPQPNEGPWVQWGFGHGHPLTGGHSEEETKKIASAVFGADSNITRQLKNEAVRRDARAAEANTAAATAKAHAAAEEAAKTTDPGKRTGLDTKFVAGGVMDTSDPGEKGNKGITKGEIEHAKHKVMQQGDALKSLPPLGGAHDLALHPNPPQPAMQCGNLVGSAKKNAAKATADAVYADPLTTYTDMPVHLPTQHDLHPDQDGAGGRCRPSVTGIFQECGPWAATD